MESEKNASPLARAKASIVTVGGGRGFVIERGGSRFVVTAAHCLLKDDDYRLSFPCSAAAFDEDRSGTWLAPLGEKPAVWAECIFADPIADIAVLGRPDNQEFSEEAAAFDALAGKATPIGITHALDHRNAYMLSLDGRWFECTLDNEAHLYANGSAPLWVVSATESIRGGMSGSPIVSSGGDAIGIACWLLNPEP